ncbi:MAG: fibronectin type III domain-containing protein [Nitrospira sp.]|nr:fibronectin type III domain-containing protein [Nitrospira sp.]
MRHFIIEHTHHTARRLRGNENPLAATWFWQVLGVTTFFCLWFTSEGLAATTISPTSLTYYAVQGATNPPNQTISVSRTSSTQATLTASDNATWLSVSPATTSMTRSATLTVAVNTNGLAAGTYQATITIKRGTWYTMTAPVTLIVSPATQPPPSTTSSATLTWDAVTGTPISGYKVYVGESPRLYTRTIDVGTVTSSTVNSLTVGRTYYFAVTAYNSAGESAQSNEVSKSID